MTSDISSHNDTLIKSSGIHDDVIKWKHVPRYWPFVWWIHRSQVNSPHKGQWRGALVFSLICVWINGCVNNGEAGDLRRYRSHYDVTVIISRSRPKSRTRFVISWSYQNVLQHPKPCSSIYVLVYMVIIVSSNDASPIWWQAITLIILTKIYCQLEEQNAVNYELIDFLSGKCIWKCHFLQNISHFVLILIW